MTTISSNLSVQVRDLSKIILNIKEFFLSVLQSIKERFSSFRSNRSQNSFNQSSLQPKRNFKKYLPILTFGFFVILVLGLVIGASYYIVKAGSKKVVNSVNVAQAKASQNLNKEFSFALKDSTGKEVSKIKFVIQNAELRDELIIQGQRAVSVQGRTFLVLNLKITNDQNQDVKINTRDYIRLSVNNGNDWLAPEVHNDPVDVQPISTKYTRLAFAINDSDKNLKLRVGEINGAKQEVKLTLK